MAQGAASKKQGKAATAYRTISEVSEDVGVPQHVLRFWETKFTAVKPLKRSGNRRYYRPEDVAVLRTIRTLLHDEGFTIKGVQKQFRQRGLRATVAAYDRAEAKVPAPMVADISPPVDGPDDHDGMGDIPLQADGKTPHSQKADLEAVLEELKAIRAQLSAQTHEGS